jgi:hypothetical protein
VGALEGEGEESLERPRPVASARAPSAVEGAGSVERAGSVEGAGAVEGPRARPAAGRRERGGEGPEPGQTRAAVRVERLNVLAQKIFRKSKSQNR